MTIQSYDKHEDVNAFGANHKNLLVVTPY